VFINVVTQKATGLSLSSRPRLYDDSVVPDWSCSRVGGAGVAKGVSRGGRRATPESTPRSLYWAHLQHHCAVEPGALVCALDAAQVEVGPVDVVAVLGQAEGVREVVHHDLPLEACRRRTRAVTPVALQSGCPGPSPKGKAKSQGTPVFLSVLNSLYNMSCRSYHTVLYT